jgi:hypothetical protein
LDWVVGLDSEINELVEGSDLYGTCTCTPYVRPSSTCLSLSLPHTHNHVISLNHYHPSSFPLTPIHLYLLFLLLFPPLAEPKVNLSQVVLPTGHLDALLAQCSSYDAFRKYRTHAGLVRTHIHTVTVYKESCAMCTVCTCNAIQ